MKILICLILLCNFNVNAEESKSLEELQKIRSIVEKQEFDRKIAKDIKCYEDASARVEKYKVITGKDLTEEAEERMIQIYVDNCIGR